MTPALRSIGRDATAGLILAGGRSRRLGREKAVADLDGEVLIARVLCVLETGCARVAVSARPGSGAAGFAASRALPCLPDGTEDVEGPLAGLRSGLRWAAAEGFAWLATAPCDTPFLPLGMVRSLQAGARDGGAVAQTDKGVQPLCALWPVSTLAALETVSGHPPIHRLQQQIGAALVRFDPPGAFANLNTPEDFELARDRSERRGAAPDGARPR